MPVRLGRYVIRRRLGSGTFAAVFEADDPALDAPVALKVLADHHSADPDVRNRFIREARLLRRSHSPRLVTIHDIGEENGQPYLVMELVSGGTLEQRLAATGPLGRSDLARLVDELEACLVELERVGVVHRDIKPSNLLVRSSRRSDALLGPDEQLVLADFGLARSTDASGLTVGGGTVGLRDRLGGSFGSRAEAVSADSTVHYTAPAAFARSGRSDRSSP